MLYTILKCRFRSIFFCYWFYFYYYFWSITVYRINDEKEAITSDILVRVQTRPKQQR